MTRRAWSVLSALPVLTLCLRVASAALVCLAMLVTAGQAGAFSEAPAVAPATVGSTSIGGRDNGPAGDGHPPIEERWGIEVTSLRLSANGHMLDYRYRVLDAEKANDLFKRQIKPYLIHQRTGKVLAVPDTAKLGPLRNSNIPQKGRIYWMFFGNAGKIVHPGDRVTVVIGELRVEDLVVE